MSKETVLANRTDHRRIVPMKTDKKGLQLAAGIAAPPGPHVTYRGGPLLEAVEVITIFWGSAWNRDQKEMVSKINKFFEDILTSPLMDQVSEYSINGYNIGHGSLKFTTNVTSPEPGGNVTGGQIEHILNHELLTNPDIPQPNGNTLYFIYVPPGITVSALGSASCRAGGFCGYHNIISGTKIYYAVMPFPSCGGCTDFGGLDTFRAMTAISSHELCEAVTDPDPGQGWYDDHNGEIGDVCEGDDKDVSGYTVQEEWSEKSRKCK